MAAPSTTLMLSGLAQRLVREGHINKSAAEKLQEKAAKKNHSLFTQLADSKKVNPAQLAQCAAEEFGIPFLDVSAMDLSQAPVNLIQSKFMERLNVLPLCKRGTKLFVAVSDPTNIDPAKQILSIDADIDGPVNLSANRFIDAK